MNTHNGHEILPLKKRLSDHELDRRTFKRQDRSVFRQRVQATFTEVGRGMGMFDAALGIIYARFKVAAWIAVAVWAATVAYIVWRLQ